MYADWPSPVVIVSDGAYGVSGFPGDCPTPAGLVEWYRPHVAEWSKAATGETTLWFWNTEVGWATVHPLLLEFGWEYVGCNIWDKGIAHVSGNTNSKTLRKFPVEHRNHHWEVVMTRKKSALIIRSKWNRPYPSKADEILDRAVHDSGRNFGRIARTGLLEHFKQMARLVASGATAQ